MRLRYLFTTISFVIVFAVVLVMLAIGFIPLSAGNQINSQSNIRNVPVERVDVRITAGATISSTTEPLVFQAASLQDGSSLLESHCAQCHNTKSLEKTKKSYAEWKKTLSHMETMGVHLNDSEKVDLLNYLTATDNR
jgi:cytochrome c5